MADDERNSAYQSSPPTTWGQSPHIYSQSAHSTPNQDFNSFPFSSPQVPMDAGTFAGGMLQQRPTYQSLQPLHTNMNMPPWPSMLNQNSYANYGHIYQQQSLPSGPASAPVPMHGMSMTPSQTPVSATSSRSISTPRKTLTDIDRKRMCQYAEDHPNSKQTEIGAVFGVERSTVSKVLRQKEKYLLQDDGSRSPIKRAKGRAPDIERALSNWVKNQRKKGIVITDDTLLDTMRAFATTAGMAQSEMNSALSASWIEKFKLRNNLLGARSRKSSLAPDDSDLLSVSQSLTQSPQSSPAIRSPSPKSQRRDSQAIDNLKTESPSDFFQFGDRPSLFHAQSTGSLGGTFVENATRNFSPGALSPVSPPTFLTDAESTASQYVPGSITSSLLPVTSSNSGIRPRSQTFPLLDQYLTSDSNSSLKYNPHSSSSALDSPMEEPDDPLGSIGEALHMHRNNSIATTSSLTHPDDDPIAHSRPSTITPSEMLPPPLPAHILMHHDPNSRPSSTHPPQHRSASLSISPTNVTMSPHHLHQPHPTVSTLLPVSAGSSTPTTAATSPTTPEEAHAALKVVLAFFEQQPPGYLDLNESLTMGKLMEKLNLQRRGSL